MKRGNTRAPIETMQRFGLRAHESKLHFVSVYLATFAYHHVQITPAPTEQAHNHAPFERLPPLISALRGDCEL
jgi:hypothetical protein